MRESTLVNKWKAEAEAAGRAEGIAEGRVEGRAEAVRDILEARFGELPAELVTKLIQTHEADLLRSWTLLAVRASSLEQFRQQAGI